jgi:hypothetical protein
VSPLSSTDPTEVVPPRAFRPIIEEIHDYLKDRDLDMQDFEVVDGAMQAIWPEMYNHDKLAAFIVVANVYLALATQYNFAVVPSYLHRAKMEGLL